MRQNTKIPDSNDFRPLFWDVDINMVDWQKNKKQIIRRILNLGNEKAYRWMFKVYSPEDIKEAVRNDKNLNPRAGVMIANYYGIKKEEVACLNNASTLNYFP